jgi:uncharacterized membrane protein
MTSATFDSYGPNPSPSAPSRVEAAGLLGLLVFTAMSTVGYGYFALHPENLPPSGTALRFYNISFQFFAQLHILIAFVALAIVLVRRSGARWLSALAAVYLLSFASEHVGTGYGIPFGGYSYTGLLGARLGPRVPMLIPLSWFLMALPCWVIARAVFPRRMVMTVGLGALGLVLWDLALDPAMSALTPYWRWEETGPYYGMPWMNLVGWFATGVLLMIALERFGGDMLGDALPVGWMAAFYAVVTALPLGMLGAAGEWFGVAVTLLSIAVTAGIVTVARAYLGERSPFPAAPVAEPVEAS